MAHGSTHNLERGGVSASRLHDCVRLVTANSVVVWLIGFWLIELINYGLKSSGGSSEMFKNPEVDFNVALSALIILIISGIFAGFIPAKRAVSIKPIDALRSE